ncbi:MAG TPA: hypothetical protein VLA28_09010 [Afifellaceae bacterium]|nr:hypothetical protein [Afifellaceae bacterium]
MLRRKTVCAALVLAFAAAPAMAQSPVNTLEWRGLNPQPEPPSANAAPPRLWIPPRP